MATPAYGYGAVSNTAPLQYMAFERRAPGPDDVSIKIAFCGVCHSDLHITRGEWGVGSYPIIVGHEIVGHVTAVGANVTQYKVGDAVGVGCLVDSCGGCSECARHLEQFCPKKTKTYGTPLPGGGVTMGGYSDHIVVKESFVLRVPKELPLNEAAPLLCAGITTYSPLRHWGVKQGTRVGVVGIGGLGHMAVKIASAMGAEVTVFTTSEGKVADAKTLGAHHVVISKDAAQMEKTAGTLDLIIDTVGTQHELPPYLNALRTDGVHVLVGAPEKPHPAFSPFSLIMARKSLAGSLIGGIKETQEMLDFCAKHGITSDVEMINIDYINTAYERMLKSDVKYRFVIDMASLKKE